MQLFARVLKDVLQSLYQPFWTAVLLAVLASFFHLFCTGAIKSGKGYRHAFCEWVRLVRKSPHCRGLLVFSFCTALILSRTLLFRELYTHPLANVLGIRYLRSISSGATAIIIKECFENTLMLMPFSFMLLWVFGDRLAPTGRAVETVKASVKASFAFSLSIETLQLALCVGQWQLSDVVFNTLGGLLGGMVYWTVHRLRTLVGGKRF